MSYTTLHKADLRYSSFEEANPAGIFNTSDFPRPGGGGPREREINGFSG